MSKLTNAIDAIAQLKREGGFSAEQCRYIDTQVRKRLGFQLARRDRKLPVYLTPSEIFHFLKVAQEISINHYFTAKLLIFTGLRVNEALNLDVRDFQDNNQLLVKVAKGGKQRMVPITSSLLNEVRMFAGNRKSGWLFQNDKGKQLSKRALQKRIETIVKKAGIAGKKLHTHSLRSTYACYLLAKGLRLEDIQLLLGHDRIETTQIYAKLELGDIKEKYLQIMGA